MNAKASRHKVFISFQEDDIEYKEKFVRLMRERIIDVSVDTGDIDDTNRKTATVRQIIRDDYIKLATVTTVLIGPCTWQRKHIDWEIGSSIRKTKRNSRCGLLSILLPNHPDYGKSTFNPHLIPPRLADNCTGAEPYTLIYHWPNPWNPAQIAEWIQQAYIRRISQLPNNGRMPFARNWVSGNCSEGWQN